MREPNKPTGIDLREALIGDEIRVARSAGPVRGVRAVLEGVGSFDVHLFNPSELVIVQRVSVRVPRAGEFRVRLESREGRSVGPVIAEVVGQPNGPGMLRLKLVNVSVDSGRALVALMQAATLPAVATVEEVIANPIRIRSLLHALSVTRCAGLVLGESSGRCKIELIHAGEDPDWPLVWQCETSVSSSSLRVAIRAPVSVITMELDRVSRVGRTLLTALPRRLVRTRRRRWRRSMSPMDVPVEFQHPDWPSVTVAGNLRDLSLEGVAFRAGSGERLLYPGLELPVVEVAGGRDAGLKLRATVCHVGEGAEAATAGLEVEPLDASMSERWWEQVSRALYPHTDVGATPVEEVWRLFEECGYVGIAGTSSKDFVPLKKAMVSVAKRIDAAPDVGCNVVWRSREGVEGALSAVRVYSGTSFGMQLAKRAGASATGWPGKSVLRELYLHAHERAQRDESIRWFEAVVRADAGWPRLARDYYQHCSSTGLAWVQRWRVVRIACGEPLIDHDSEYEVAPADNADLALLTGKLAETHVTAYREGLDLTAEQIDFESVRSTWRRAGLLRDRCVLVARQQGKSVAAGVFEVCDDGVHIYGLLDAAKLYALADGGTAAFAPLLAQGSAWFGRLGKRSFVLFEEEGEVADLSGLATEDMGLADLSLISVELLPDFMEWIWEVTATSVQQC